MKGHPQTAKEDIIVYKGCNSVFKGNRSVVISPCFDFCYKKDVLYETKFSYTNNLKFSDSLESDYYNNIRYGAAIIADGFHSFAGFERAKKWNTCDHCCEFIIPKGAKFYLNAVGNYVSNKIIFKRIINKAEKYFEKKVIKTFFIL
jgi:hypothetical protein